MAWAFTIYTLKLRKGLLTAVLGAGGEQELDRGWPMFITRGYWGSGNIKRLQARLNIDRIETKLHFVEIFTFH